MGRNHRAFCGAALSNNHWVVTGLATSMVAAFFSAGCGREKVEGPTPNIIFVLVDTLRADRLGPYGNPDGHSPTFDAIAADGVVFERAIAQSPWTQPSIASLFTSRHPTVHQVLRYHTSKNGGADESNISVLSDSLPTLAESLRGRGYATAAFVANPLLLKEYGFAQGFDHYDTSFAKNTTAGGVVNDAVVSWLKQRDRSRPFFLYLHYMDVHGPYNAGPEFLDELLDAVDAREDKYKLSEKELKRLGYLRKLPKALTQEARHNRLLGFREYWEARYESGIREFDHYLGSLQERLRALDVWDTAYVILTADHGEALCEHGLWKHGWSMHHTDLHVPLVFRWPGVLPAGKRVRQTVSLIDVMPTLIDQLGLPKIAGMQGVSLKGSLAGAGRTIPPPAFAEAIKIGPEQKSVYQGGWKLMLTVKTGKRKLYNIARDPGETSEVSSQFPLEAMRLTKTLKTQMADNTKLAKQTDSRMTPATAEQVSRLKSLGYLGGE